MPVSLHVLLMHGPSYLKMISLPVSFLTEQSLETNNKISKHARLHHTRKISRSATMKDHFDRLMDVSDPVIANELHSRKQAKIRHAKEDDLPEDVLALLFHNSLDGNE